VLRFNGVWNCHSEYFEHDKNAVQLWLWLTDHFENIVSFCWLSEGSGSVHVEADTWQTWDATEGCSPAVASRW
jgi:hypothetical protein